jgi:hypothetical protein
VWLNGIDWGGWENLLRFFFYSEWKKLYFYPKSSPQIERFLTFPKLNSYFARIRYKN